ncbi:MAG: hypothetical protein ACOC3I_06120 [Verrucomicrobiota bacterium]
MRSSPPQEQPPPRPVAFALGNYATAFVQTSDGSRVLRVSLREITDVQLEYSKDFQSWTVVPPLAERNNERVVLYIDPATEQLFVRPAAQN